MFIQRALDLYLQLDNIFPKREKFHNIVIYLISNRNKSLNGFKLFRIKLMVLISRLLFDLTFWKSKEIKKAKKERERERVRGREFEWEEDGEGGAMHLSTFHLSFSSLESITIPKSLNSETIWNSEDFTRLMKLSGRKPDLVIHLLPKKLFRVIPN